MVETSPSSTAKHRQRLVIFLLVLILALGAFLRFYRLGSAGVGNAYYAAAVESMTQSWHNFFFVAFEPGGSVSVDKPPLGFWIECLSAVLFGLNGFSLALPNAVAGVLSIPVIFFLVRRPFGNWVGLLAALALAVTPVAVSAERNNTIDGMLAFVLLLAAWAFLHSIYTRKVSWLLLGAFLVGLGFNIKMLQAFLPLPGLYALYLFAARYKWWQKILHLALATLLLLVVSFSWAVAIDLTAAENRPYVGGSENNTVMELIFGHNGISRLIGSGLNRIRQDAPSGTPGGQTLPYGRQPPPGLVTPGEGFPSLQPSNLPVGPAARSDRSGDSGGIMDVGTPGTLRLFTFPLAGEIGWIFPIAICGLILIPLALGVKRPLTEKHASFIFWAGWLLPEAVYFTYSTGIMHAYYMIMMAAPLAALLAMTGWAIWELLQKQKWLNLAAIALVIGGTILFQANLMSGSTPAGVWVVAGATLTLVTGLIILGFSKIPSRMAAVALTLSLLAALAAPTLWSALTTFNPTPNAGLPYSGPAQADSIGQKNGSEVPARLLDYLLANSNSDAYLLATVTANQAAPFILATGRPVLTFGGFGGMDQIVDAAGLAEMVAAGELRFVLNEGLEQRPEILTWVQQNCQPGKIPGLPLGERMGPGVRQGAILYDCGR